MMVATAIASIIGLVGSFVLLQLTSANLKADNQYQATQLVSDFFKLASNYNTCSTSITLGTTIATPTAVNSSATQIAFDLKDGGGGSSSSVIQQNVDLPKYKLKVLNSGFTFTVPAGLVREPRGSNFIWHGILELALQKSVGSQEILKPFVVGPFSVEVNSANQIVGCVSQTISDPADLCTTLGGTWSAAGCTFAQVSCGAGTVRTGPNIPADCMSCPPGNMLVSTGSGFSCQPYITCSIAGTSKTGLGAPAIPAGCKCNNAGEIWNGAICIAPGVTCPSQVLSWTVGVDSCDAAFPITADTVIESGDDLLLPTSGTAQFRCSGGAWSALPEPGSTCIAGAPPPPVCPAGSSTAGGGAPTNVVGCFCNGIRVFDGTSCVFPGGGGCFNCTANPITGKMSCVWAVICS